MLDNSAEIDASGMLAVQQTPVNPDGAGPTNATHVVPPVISTNLVEEII